jgi:5-methylcytosine-specific restriction endonuclease McrA
MIKKCFHCGELKDTEKDFYKGEANGRYCKKCRCRYEWEKTLIRKILAVLYKGGKCQDCGYDGYYGALEFHHVNPEEKEMSWKAMRVCSWDKMMKELDKCILLCSNCHSELHAKAIGEITWEHNTFNNIRSLNGYEKIEKNIDGKCVYEYVRKKVFRKCQCCKNDFEVPVWNKNQKFCSISCSGKFLRKVKNRPSKEELEKLISELSWVKLGKKYGITANSVKKWARSYDLI